MAANPAIAELHRLPSTIPVVFTRASDPVGSGFVPGFARPGGNITALQESDEDLPRVPKELADAWTELNALDARRL